MKNVLLAILFLATSLTAVKAEPNERRASEEELGLLKFTHSPIELDSVLSVWYKNNITDSYDTFVNEFINDDFSEDYSAAALPDSIYEARLDMLATEIQLPYNPIVKNYILRYTSKGAQKSMQRLLGLAQYYMPIFEAELDLHGLPLELKILPIIESGLNPKAVSRVGASGLWQFMLRTGKFYGLESNSFVDGRYDPVASTRAACQYLKDMYKIYGDWTLVIASYNCGAGNVNKAIRRAGPNAKTYWDIYEYLPRETRGYVPAFIAATYAYTFHKAHDLDPVLPPHPVATDTVMVNKMMHFDQVTSTLGNISIEAIRDLNPQYKLDIIPAKEKSYPLILPAEELTNFVANEAAIYAKDTIYMKKYLNVDNLSTASAKAATSSKSTRLTYKVKKGDNLGSIAKRHGTTSKKIMALNGIKNANRISIGQTLVIRK